MHSGGVTTDLLRPLPDDVIEGFGKDLVLSKIFENPKQGPATTICTASAAVLEGNGGRYLSSCQIVGLWEPSLDTWGQGHAAWAYDPEKEAKLWLCRPSLLVYEYLRRYP